MVALIELVVGPHLLVSLFKRREDTSWSFVGMKIVMIILTIGTIVPRALEWRHDEKIDYPYWAEFAAVGGVLAFILNTSALYLVLHIRRKLLSPEPAATESDLDSPQQQHKELFHPN